MSRLKVTLKQSQTVLVTGSNGQLGKTLKELYLNNDLGLQFVFANKKDLDITDLEAVNIFFNKHKFDYCINTAAYTNVEQAEKTPEPAYTVNAEGVKHLALACKTNNVVLIHISTDYVFDGKKQIPYTIHDSTNPINEYGKSKLKGEQYIQDILHQYFIVRTSWLYSKKYGKNFYRTILTKAQTENILYVTDQQIGCPTNTEHLAQYLVNGLILSKTKNFGIKHFSDRQVMTWYDFALQILSENQLNTVTTVVKSDNYVTFAKRPKCSILG